MAVEFSVEECKEALESCHGFVTSAVAYLNGKGAGDGSGRHVKYTVLYGYIKKTPELQNYLKEIQDQRNDVIEDVLYRRAVEGDLKAVMFWLNSKAKDRGYGWNNNTAATSENTETAELTSYQIPAELETADKWLKTIGDK